MFSLLLRHRRSGPGAAAKATSPVKAQGAGHKPVVRDSQRAKVYAWERAHVFVHDSEIMSMAACRALVLEAYRWWERPSTFAVSWRPPEVQDGRGRRHACGSREVIKLPRWARTRPVVLHECAHGMADDKHGPAFVRAYVELLVEFTNIEREVLNKSLVKARVRMAPRFQEIR